MALTLTMVQRSFLIASAFNYSGGEAGHASLEEILTPHTAI
jgi:hypothetical protein